MPHQPDEGGEQHIDDQGRGIVRDVSDDLVQRDAVAVLKQRSNDEQWVPSPILMREDRGMRVRAWP
jgi:hypothetical protein